MVIGDVTYGDPTALMGHYCVPVSGVTCRANTGSVSPYVLCEAALRRSLVPPPPPPPQRQWHYVDESYDSSSSSLSSSEEGEGEDAWEEEEEEESWEVYASTDGFRMYEFKVRACRRRRSHNWTECPFAHPGEKAARRDPRRFAYSGEPCPEFRRRGACDRGDACDLAHGVFECWLHPARYRTQPCKDGTACRRPVCFFAHTLAQLRLPLPLPPHHTSTPSCCSAADKSSRRRRSMKEKRVFSAAMAELRLCKSMPSSWKYRSNAAAFETSTSTGTGTGQQHSWCAEEEEAAAAEEMSAPNFDWVSDLLK